MYSSATFIIVFLFIQGGTSLSHEVRKRSPQQIDIQSVRQKQISPDITVVDVVVNEPTRKQYPYQNTYIQNIDQGRYPVNKYYPNNPYLNPTRRQPEIQIIEVIDPTAGTQINNKPWQQFPGNRRDPAFPFNNGSPDIYVIPSNPGRFPGNPAGDQFYPGRPNRPNRRPMRPNNDFFIREDDNDFTEPPRQKPPGHRGHRRKPKPNKNNKNSKESSEEEDNERYIFDAGDNTSPGSTDDFPVIPLNKNDIRK